MKKLFAVLLLTSLPVFASLQTRVICGSGTSNNPTEALRKANDDLNRKLENGVTKLQSVSHPVFTAQTGSSQYASVCVTVIAESFSDLAL